MSQHDILFELGCEELPARLLASLSEQLRCSLQAELAEVGLSHGEVIAYATPRRLAVWVKECIDKQPAQRIQRRGPSVASAYDADGTPTLACLGFARSCGVSADELSVQKSKKGDWLYYEGEVAGKTTTSLLPGVIQKAVAGLVINKGMRWGAGDAIFLRPVQWLLLSVGGDVCDVSLFGLQSADITYGHRFHQPQAIRIQSPASYAQQLQEEGMVVACLQKRKQAIAQALRAAAADYGTLDENEALLDEVAALVEWPVIQRGQIEERYLALPREVLMTSLQVNQKCFTITDKRGRLAPVFLLVSNIDSRHPPTVIKGNERVIRARLADAEFFFAQDKQQPLSKRRADLEGIVFAPALGSMLDKTKRLATLVQSIAVQMDVDKAQAKAATMLAKCDLTTHMVGEFSSLQGVMGGIYAEHDAEPKAVATAIAEHYYPRFSADSLPTQPLSRTLALADRLDTLVGIIGTRGKPKGDKDPYALRRAALGVVRIVCDVEQALPLDHLIKQACRALKAVDLKEGVAEQTLSFIMDRFRAWVLEQGISPQQYQSVAALGLTDLADMMLRLQAVAQFADDPAAASLASANKRVMNILKKTKPAASIEIDKKYFEHEAEKALLKAIGKAESALEKALKKNNYVAALSGLAVLKEPVDDFFTNVMIMADDKALQQNRLAMLAALKALLTKVVVLSEL